MQEDKYKKAKAKEKERKEKLKELEASELPHMTSNLHVTSNNNNKSANNDDDDGDDDILRAPRSNRSLLGLSWLNQGLSNGHSSPGRDGAYSDRYNPRSARQILPPLDDSPLEGTKGKKRNKKLKNKIGVNEMVDDDNDDYRMYNSNITSSVSRIQVESMHQPEEDSDDVVPRSGGRRDPFRKSSQGRYKQEEDEDSRSQYSDSSKKKVKKKKQTSLSECDDGFDTLRLSQHFDERDSFGMSSPDIKPFNGKFDFKCAVVLSQINLFCF